jgi:hypothetical protein
MRWSLSVCPVIMLRMIRIMVNLFLFLLLYFNESCIDLYEMGRLMGGDCMLQGQFHAKNRPVTSPLPYDNHYPSKKNGGGGYYERPQDREGTGNGYGYRPGNDKTLLPGDRTNFFQDKKYNDDRAFPRPGQSSINSESSSSDHYDSDRMQYVNDRSSPPLSIPIQENKSHYDQGTSGREGILALLLLEAL